MAKYLDLVQWLRDKIRSGQFQPGDKILSERELCALFKVSRQTTRQAIGLLASEGLVACRRGSGTYVASLPVRRVPSRQIGVVTTYLDDYIFPSIIRGIEGTLASQGYNMQLAITSNDLANESRILVEILNRDLGGLIIEPAQSALPTVNWHLYRRITDAAIPCVLIHSAVPGSPLPCVANDDFAGGQLAAQHLLDNGHRRIGGIFKSDDMQGHLRYSGFAYSLRCADIPLDSKAVIWYATHEREILFDERRNRDILDHLAGCTAIVCYNDQIAADLAALYKRNGIAVPGQVSLVGFDNSSLAERLDSGLTSIAHPMETLGRIAAEQLIRRIGDPSYIPGIRFPPQIVRRNSVRRLVST